MKRLTALTILVFFGFVFVYAQYGSDSSKINDDSFTRFRIGGYGEIVYQQMDFGPDRYSLIEGAPPTNRSMISIPRMVLGIDYKFNPSLQFSTEIEFEHGGTGAAMELEYDEMGEYEMEVEHGGEVVLEQFHLTKTFSKALNVRIGHMIVPVGNTNAYHMPTEYFTTVRPEGEMTIIPLTWHETGIAILGQVKRWSYEVQLVNGLDANGFSSANWVQSGKQGVFEGSIMTQPALTGRIGNRSIRNLRIGASGYYGKSAKNTTKPEKMEGIDGAVTILSGEAEYNNQNLLIRGSYVYGDLSDSYEITSVNKNLSNNTQYARTPVAKNATTYGIEAGYDVLSFFNSREKLYPFARYEYYNSMQATENGILADERYNRQVVTFGLNYYMLPNMALKIDYSKRIIANGKYNTENTFGLAMVYTGWFFQK